MVERSENSASVRVGSGDLFDAEGRRETGDMTRTRAEALRMIGSLLLSEGSAVDVMRWGEGEAVSLPEAMRSACELERKIWRRRI